MISINGEIPPVDNCDMYDFLQKFFNIPIKIILERENKVIEIEQVARENKYLTEK